MRIALLTAALASPLQAQLVRGTVTERTSNAPLAGVLVELERAGAGARAGARVASGLSDANGVFSLRAPAAGRYVVTAKRIGVRRYASPPIDVAADGVTTITVVLEALQYRLPEIVVEAGILCARDPDEGARLDAMWEEARTALDATQISLRDRLYRAHVTRYARELDPKTRRVMSETQSETRATVASPFNSPAPDSLSARGYWRADAGGVTTYAGPDAQVLLSESFRRDHCFSLAEGTGPRAGLAGLTFFPVAGRRVADITGTMWLDARTSELRFVDFSYDRVPAGVDSSAVGGELHFARLPNGAWIVRQWSLRLPLAGRPTQPVSTEGSAPWVLVRPGTFRLAEEGGIVTTDELRPAERLASISGTLRDSTGRRALAGALVRLGGTTRTAMTDSVGRFRFDAVDRGDYTVVAEVAGYDSLGMAAAEAPLSLGAGERRELRLGARTGRDVTTRLCGEAAPFGRGTIHLTLLDSVTARPLVGWRGSARWASSASNNDGAATTVTGATNARGSLALCAVAGERAITLTIARPDGDVRAERRLTIVGREVRHLTLRLKQ